MSPPISFFFHPNQSICFTVQADAHSLVFSLANSWSSQQKCPLRDKVWFFSEQKHVDAWFVTLSRWLIHLPRSAVRHAALHNDTSRKQYEWLTLSMNYGHLKLKKQKNMAHRAVGPPNLVHYLSNWEKTLLNCRLLWHWRAGAFATTWPCRVPSLEGSLIANSVFARSVHSLQDSFYFAFSDEFSLERCVPMLCFMLYPNNRNKP